MARFHLGAVSLAVLLVAVGATSAAGVTRRGPRLSDTLVLGVAADPVRVVAADLNGDGNSDLATVNWNSRSASVLFSRGDGNFNKRVDYRAPRHPAGIVSADVNADGRPDLITASHDRHGTIAIWLNGGAGRFVRAGTYTSAPLAWAVAAADVNGDGAVDLLTAHQDGQQLAVLIGIGDGRFHGAQRYRGRGANDLAVGDLNRDGTPDVALAVKGKRNLAVRLGRGDGSFAVPVTYKAGYAYAAIVLADFNRDQILDVAPGSEVMLGDGNGTFRLGWQDEQDDVDATAAGDLDADGDVDLLSSGDAPALLLGDGGGRFVYEESDDEGPTTLGVDSAAISGAIADFNGDGLSDLALIATCDYDCPFGTVLAWLNWTGQAAKPCVVPDVTEYSPIGGTLRDFGCRLGRVRHRHSRTPKGWAIRQRPKPGTVLPSGTRVDVVVSLGRRRHHSR